MVNNLSSLNVYYFWLIIPCFKIDHGSSTNQHIKNVIFISFHVVVKKNLSK
jgi:hypothetical protein